MVLHPLTPAQVPLPPSVTTSGGRSAALIRRTSLSFYALRRQQARYHLVQLLFVASLTDSPPLVDDVVGRLSSITRIRVAKRADLEALLLPDGSAPFPDDIEDLLSIAHYTDRYLVARGDRITKTMWSTMWSDMKNEHYVLFLLILGFPLPLNNR